MTEQDDELKDLFQQKNLENAFSPDEENWEKMAAVLKNEKNNKRRFFVYFSLLLFLGAGLSWFVVTQQEQKLVVITPQTSTSKNVEPLSNNQPIEQNKSTAPIQEEKISKPVESEKNKPEIKKTETPATEYKNNLPLAEKLNPDKIGEQTVEKNQDPITKKATATPPVSTEFFEQKQPIKNTTDPLSSVKAPDTNTEVAPVVDAETKDSEPKVREEETVVTPSVKRNPSGNQATKIVAEDLLQKNTNEPVADAETNFVQEVLLTDVLTPKTIRVFAEQPDFTTVPLVSLRDSALPKKLLSHRIFVEAGLNYQLGWKTNNQTEANGINPLVGLNYYHDVSRRVGLSVGLMYTSINNLSATSHTSTTTRLKFGEEVEATVVSAQNMHYLLIPLKLSYSLSRNDFVCIGYTFAYLLDVQSNVETYSTRMNYTSTPVVSKSMGYTKGFNSYDGQIAVCYRRRLYKEIYANGELFYGLRDIKNDVIYKSNALERSYGFRFSVGINLWKK